MEFNAREILNKDQYWNTRLTQYEQVIIFASNSRAEKRNDRTQSTEVITVVVLKTREVHGHRLLKLL